MSDKHITKLVIWLLILSLCIWFWLVFLPKEFNDTMDRHRQSVKPTVEDYIEQGWDPYEYEGDWNRPPYIEDEEAGPVMPGPMLECEAGDHTCID